MPCIRCQLQHGELTYDVLRLKNLLASYLNQFFLDYVEVFEVFSDIGDVSSRAILCRWLTPDRLRAHKSFDLRTLQEHMALLAAA